MRKRPVVIQLTSIAYLLAAGLNIIETLAHTEEIYPHQILFLVVYPVIAYGVARVRRWGWYFLMAHLGFLIISNTYLYLEHKEPNPLLLVQLAVLAVLIVFMSRSNIRWVRWGRRFIADFEASARLANSEEAVAAKGLNVSTGGCFVRIDGVVPAKPHEPLALELTFPGHDSFTMQGRVANLVDSGDGIVGVAVAFTRSDSASQAALCRVIDELRDRSEL